MRVFELTIPEELVEKSKDRAAEKSFRNTSSYIRHCIRKEMPEEQE